MEGRGTRGTKIEEKEDWYKKGGAEGYDISVRDTIVTAAEKVFHFAGVKRSGVQD